MFTNGQVINIAKIIHEKIVNKDISILSILTQEERLLVVEEVVRRLRRKPYTKKIKQ